MSKQEVLFILGTPMVIDPFNEQRWDYYYSYKDYDKRTTNSRIITALFVGDSLTGLQGEEDAGGKDRIQERERIADEEQTVGCTVFRH